MLARQHGAMLPPGLIQPHVGRFHTTVQTDGYAHQVKHPSAVTLERAKMHVDRRAMDRCSARTRRDT